jgi:type IV pilus biogenesis protein CpaD/CtpE
MQASAPEPQAQENAVLATPVSATSVCEQRTTSVHFGARGSALSQPNRNAIQYAADAASVCDLQTVTIVDSAEGRTSSRRAEAVRATLISQGIPAERITVSQETNADAEAASTGRLDVRMAFAGVADGGNPATAAAAPAATPTPLPAADPPPAVTPQAPDTMTPPPAEGGPAGEEDTDPTPST